MHVPTVSFHLGTKSNIGEREKELIVGNDEEDTSCLFIWNIFAKARKKVLFPVVEMIDLLPQ